MQVFVELLAAAVVATAAAALSWFGVEMTPPEEPRASAPLLRKTPVHTNMIIVTPPARRTHAVPC